jgi:hypothetical protein
MTESSQPERVHRRFPAAAKRLSKLDAVFAGG